MDNEYYMLTESGRHMGDVLVALYKANKFLSVSELVTLSGKSENVVKMALNVFGQDFGGLEQVDDAGTEKYGLQPDVRFAIRSVEINVGKDF